MLACAWVISATPGIAIAADTGNEVAARVLFTEGRKLSANGDYGAACPKFEESFRLDPGIGTSFNLADCWEHIGRTASAWARFLDVAASARAAGQFDRERLARQRAEALEPSLSRLVVEVTVAGQGLSVERDGLALRDASWGIAVPVDPGPHLVEASAPGKKKWSNSVPVPAGGELVAVAIPELEDQPQPRDTPASPPPAQPATVDVPAVNSTSAPPALVPVIGLGALAVAGWVTSAILAVDFNSANTDAKKLCTDNNACKDAGEKAQHDQLVNDARRDRNLALAAAGIGVAAAVTAAVLWWRPFSAHPTTTQTRVALRPAGAVIELTW
jgi:hypothetical protein